MSNQTATYEIDADFAMLMAGDGLVDSGILDGNILFVKECENVNNGEIAVVNIGESTILRRIYYYPDSDSLLLKADNPRYEPLVFTGKEREKVNIIGEVVSYLCNLKKDIKGG